MQKLLQKHIMIELEPTRGLYRTTTSQRQFIHAVYFLDNFLICEIAYLICIWECEREISHWKSKELTAYRDYVIKVILRLAMFLDTSATKWCDYCENA